MSDHDEILNDILGQGTTSAISRIPDSVKDQLARHVLAEPDFPSEVPASAMNVFVVSLLRRMAVFDIHRLAVAVSERDLTLRWAIIEAGRQGVS